MSCNEVEKREASTDEWLGMEQVVRAFSCECECVCMRERESGAVGCEERFISCSLSLCFFCSSQAHFIGLSHI